MKTTYRAMKDGKMTTFNVPQDKIEKFLKEYPNAVLVEGKTQGAAQDATATLETTASVSQSGSTFSDLQTQKNSLDTLRKGIESDQKTLTNLKSSIEDAKAFNNEKLYNDLTAEYNKVLKTYKDNYGKYQSDVGIYNTKLDTYKSTLEDKEKQKAPASVDDINFWKSLKFTFMSAERGWNSFLEGTYLEGATLLKQLESKIKYGEAGKYIADHIMDEEWKKNHKMSARVMLSAPGRTNLFGHNAIVLDAAVDYQQAQLPQFETSINEDFYKAITTGDMNLMYQAGVRTVDGAIMSAPSYLAAMLGPGGLAALAITTAGNKFEEEFDKDPSRSINQLYINSVVSGTIEAGFEYFTARTMARAGLLKGVDVNAAKALIAGGAYNTSKHLLKDFGSGAVSEMATELTSAMWDRVSLGRKIDWSQLKNQVLDAGIIGGFTDGTTSSVGVMSGRAKRNAEELFMSENSKAEVLLRAETINKLQKDLENADDEGKKLIQDRIDAEVEEVKRIKRRNSKELSTLKGDALKKYAENIQKIQEAKRVHAKAKTETEKDLANEQYKEATKSNADIMKQSLQDYTEQSASKMQEMAGKLSEAGGPTGTVETKTSDEIEAMDMGFVKAEESDIETGNVDADGNKLDDKGNKIKKSTLASNQYGTIIQDEQTGDYQIIINKDVPAIGVAAHEFFHALLFNTLGKNPEVAKALQEALDDHVNTLKGDQTEMRRRLEESYKDTEDFSEETITIISESILNGDLKYDEGFFTKLRDIFRRFLQNQGIVKEIKLDTGRDVYNFIKDFVKSVESGKVSDAIIQVGAKGAKGKLVDDAKAKAETKAKTKAKAETKAETKTKFSMTDPMTDAEKAEVKRQIDEIGNMGWDQDTWDSQGADLAIDEIKSNKLLDRIIGSKMKAGLKANTAEHADFIAKVYSELTKHIKGFNDKLWGTPDQNDSLFGWIVPQIGNKANAVYNREYKDKTLTRAVQADAVTPEGAPVVQLEADTDTEIIRFEEQDLTKKEVEQRSKLRRDLKLDKPMITKVKQAVIKTFGTKLPDVQAKNFRAALQKAFRTELKKPIQDMMGGRTEYDSFLTNHFEAIYKALPVETLIQMERMVSPDKRIFTSSRRITKPSEVDKLISQNKLPKNTNRDSGPLLNTKKPMPSMDKVIAFFRGTDMEAILGYKLGASTLGTRKDKLAMSLAEELAFDATSEVLQDPAVKAKRQGILEIQGFEGENDLAKVAEKIDRDPNIKFSLKKPNTGNAGLDLKLDAETTPRKMTKALGVDPLLIFRVVEKISRKRGRVPVKVVDFETEINNLKEKGLTTLGEQVFRILDKFGKMNPEYIGLFRVGMVNGQGKSMFGVKSVFNMVSRGIDYTISNYVKRFRFHEGRRLSKLRVYKNSNGDIIFNIGGKEYSAKDFVDNQDQKLDLYVKLFEDIAEHLKTDMGDAWFFERFIIDASSNGDAIPRTSATLVGIPQDSNGDLIYDKEVEEEHMLPQNQVNRMLFAAALRGDDMKFIKKLLKASFAQMSLLETDNSMVTAAGFKTTMPEAFWSKVIPALKDGKLDWLGRGMAAIIRYAESGINLNKYYVPSLGKNIRVTDHFGVGVDISKMNNEQLSAVVQKQNQLITDILTGEITREEAGKRIEAFVKSNSLVGPKEVKTRNLASKAISNRVKYSKSGESKGMSTFDFDETLIIDGKNFVVATDPKTGQVIQISSDQWPIQGPQLAEAGFQFDFSDFANVRGGKEGPLLQKMKNQIAKYGNKNVFVLTARQQDSAKPIKEWLKSKGIDIPLRNITGLGKSEGSAKGEWMLQKFAEGYNDMYFVDDAMSNVEAVRKVLDNLDIKSKVVQAKVKFSKSASKDFNDMLERSKGVKASLEFSDIDAKLRGAKRDRFRIRFFVPPSAEDLKGLVYAFLSKGEQGNKDLAWFKDNLFNPFAKGIRELNSLRQKMSEEYTALKKQFPNVIKSLNDKVANTEFTVDNAIRVYLWNMAGFDVPGLSDAQKKLLIDHVAKNAELVAFADVLSNITRTEEGYVKPADHWIAQNIGSDLHTVAETINRKKFLAEWQENVDLIFSKENLNKIEAVYGSNFREALEDMLYRMKTGSNRPSGRTSVENKFLNWVNGAVSAVMFFNMRSATLQSLSMVNFLNFEDNNIFKAAKAFANQKQFWADFIYLFNSDMLKQRRAGLKIDVSASELTDAFAQGKNKTEAVIKYMLEKGFIPTKMMDSFAIAMGGSTFYRNRVQKYLSEGMSRSEAEEQAFLDFQEIAEETQQSSRPDLISMQQASSLGRLILAWANTPMQYTRLTKKALSDIVNGRGDIKANMSRILYYGAVQNIIFGTLQTGLAFLMFGDDEEDKDRDKKEQRVLNGVLDTLLRGVGVYGALVSAAKNALIAAHEELGKGYGQKDYSKIMQQLINLSPPIGSKVRKIIGAIKSYDFNKDIIDQMDHGINNPAWNIFTGVVEGVTNAPLDRIRAKMVNVREAIVGDHEMWQRVALFWGWNKWDLNVRDAEIEQAREKAKEQKKQDKKKEKDKTKKKKYRCTAIKSDGKRCKNQVDKKVLRCYAHR